MTTPTHTTAPTGPAALSRSLAAAGFPTAALSDPAMGAVCALPHGARVLGLFPGGGADNLLWSHPDLAQPDTARAAFTATDWVHFGGDRTWVSPERELFLGDLARPWETYRVPAVVDPGSYTLAALSGELHWLGQSQLFFNPRQQSTPVEIEKRVRLLPDPLRLDPPFNSSAGVRYAGYEQSVSLRLLEPAAAPPVSLWNILVVPASGWAIVPVWGEARVRDFFAPTPPERLRVGPRAVAFQLDGLQQHKIALRAAYLAGRAGFLRELDAQHSSLLVRSFAVNPSGDYIDTPWEAPGETGYAFQSYNDGGSLGGFGELEYHTPAIGGGRGSDQLTDVSQVWGYTGPTPAIRRIAAHLLGAGSLAGL